MNSSEVEFWRVRAKKIERALIRNGWTRVHLAELTGYDERTIRNVLSGKPVRGQPSSTFVRRSVSSRSLTSPWSAPRRRDHSAPCAASSDAGRAPHRRDARIHPAFGECARCRPGDARGLDGVFGAPRAALTAA
jgi:hypothetical protein